MPILPAEPDLYPPDLWQTDDPARGPNPDEERLWWCLHTKPRQEKAVARELRGQHIPYYLPQVVHEDRTPQGRKTRSVLPLFTSYLFLLGNDRDRVQALKGNRLVRVIEVANQRALRHDLRQVHQMLSSGLAVVPVPSVPVGARVRILTGPLTGVEGRVVRRGKRDQFVAVVHFLGSGAMVELEDWQVEQLSDDDDSGPSTPEGR
jgi:transcriptional antiterminator RfaH